MKPKFLLCLALVLSGGLFGCCLNTKHESFPGTHQTSTPPVSIDRPAFSNAAPDKVQIWSLTSDVEKTYGVRFCYEDFSDEKNIRMDDIYFNPADFDLSKMKLNEVLKKMETQNLVCITNEPFLVFRLAGYPTNNNPLLEKTIPPFKFNGTLYELVGGIARKKGIGIVCFENTSDFGPYKFPPIALDFDSVVSIEDVLFLLAKKYGVRWRTCFYYHVPQPYVGSMFWIDRQP